MKIFKKITIYILISALLVLLTFNLITTLKVQNVLDEIYYNWANSLYTKTSIYNVEALADNDFEPHSHASEIFHDKVAWFYDEKYLQDNATLWVFIQSDLEKMSFYATMYFPNTNNEEQDLDDADNLFFYYTYNISTKEITINELRLYSDLIRSKYPERFPEEIAFEDEASLLEFFELHGVTKEDLDEYKDYILNEVIIGGWVEGNKGKTRFSSEDPGDFIVIDNSYQNLGEEWQD